MLEAYIQAVRTEDPGLEEPAATRDRLKGRLPRGATRRMTQLGLLVGAVLDDLAPTAEDTLVYASAYAESRALEGYLDSFPAASPTLFQTSIHPSAVQQVLIARQRAVRQFFPMTGRAQLVAHALQTALLADTPRALLCGGEERGTWLLDHGVASARSFAFGLALVPIPERTMGKISLEPDSSCSGKITTPADDRGIDLAAFFDALHARRPLDVAAAPGLRLILAWA